MLIDTDLIFDELEGYAFLHRAEVISVIEDKVKCIDGEVIKFIDDIEYLITEGDEIILLERKETPKELKKLLNYLIDRDDESELIEHVRENIIEAEKTGAYRSYSALCNDDVLSVYDFKL